MDDVIKVNPAGMADYTHSVATFSAELDNIASTALNTLGGIAEYFTTEQASVSYSEAQQLIIQGINEGKEVLMRHGSAVDTAQADYVAQDGASASTFI